MRLRTTLMVAVLLVASMAAGVGGAAATDHGSTDSQDAPADLRRPDEAVNNSTDTRYRGVEPSSDYADKPVRLGSAPDDFTPGTDSGGAGTSGAASASSIVMDSADDSADHPAVGTTKFYLGSDTDGYYFKAYTLLAVTNHSEIWVARNLSWPAGDPRTDPTISEAQAEALAAQFEQNMYPVESKVFGTPKPRNGTSGLLEQIGAVPDNYYKTGENSGNRTVVLVDNIRDKNFYNPSYPLYIAGFYSPTIQRYTDRNTIAIDAYGWDQVNESDRTVGYEGTLAHEFQHLIHGDLDGNEKSWINEGMSDYAEIITGYGVPESHLSAYEQMPSNSLVNWEDQGAINVLADYGAAFTFQMYLADQYGRDFISNLAHDSANGIAGVENTLHEVGAKTDFYGLYQDFSTAVVTDRLGNPPKDRFKVEGVDLNVNTSNGVDSAGLYGADYRTIDTANKGPITGVTVSGTAFTDTDWRTATDPVDGEGAVLYSGSGNLLDRHAIVSANLSTAENPRLTFETYYRIEKNWDYGFVQVSTDGGETWQSLETERMDDSPSSSAHPRVKANAPGYSGRTDGWVTQSVDLSEYAGQNVLISFRYTTDWAVESPGWYVRNVSVAGTSVPTDSTAPWMSLREATGNNVEYQFSFVGVKHNGNYKVKQLDMRTFSDSERRELTQFLHNGNFEKVIVVSTWAGKPGESGRVPVDVEFTFQHENDGEQNGKNGKQKGKKDKQKGKKDKQKGKNGTQKH